MGENTKIEWAHHTFNPWIGCTKVSPGCAHCYAEEMMDTRYGNVRWGAGHPRKRTRPENWQKPRRWNQMCEAKGIRQRVFCASLGDVFDREVPIEWLADLFHLIRQTPHLDWLLLTKRPKLMESRIMRAQAFVEDIDGDWPDCDPTTDTGEMLNDWIGGEPPANIWLGVSVENQEHAMKRIPILVNHISAKKYFLSCEPLLGPVDLLQVALSISGNDFIDWVIVGGESGPKARPMHVGWARMLRTQCEYGGIPFMFKQWGEHDMDGKRVGKAAAGRHLDGRLHDEVPE